MVTVQGGSRLPESVGHLVRRSDQRPYHLGLDFAAQESGRGPSSTSVSSRPRDLSMVSLAYIMGSAIMTY